MDDLWKEIRRIVRAHCCSGCDGYQCPNGGAGDSTDATTDEIYTLIERVRKE